MCTVNDEDQQSVAEVGVMPTVSQVYAQRLHELGYQGDAAQMAAVTELARCEQELEAYDPERARKKFMRWLSRAHKVTLPKGVYMYGGVGRGKSFLMDCFFEAVQIEGKRRLHFHEFMREVHQQLHRLQGTVNPLDVLAREIAVRHPLICFDEFHVSNVTDAMILYRLLCALFDHGVCMVTTSNFEPDGLYPNGLQRERILPAIALIKEKMRVISVDAGIDYRRQTLSTELVYHTPLGLQTEERMRTVYEKMCEGLDMDTALVIEHRKIDALRCCANVGWFSFAQLCATPRSQNDYLALSDRFDVIMVSSVPQMKPNQASEARRFTLLVDVLYDRRVKLVVSAATAPELLYTEGALAHEFVRTVSRLVEMQSQEYLAEPVRRARIDLT